MNPRRVERIVAAVEFQKRRGLDEASVVETGHLQELLPTAKWSIRTAILNDLFRHGGIESGNIA